MLITGGTGYLGRALINRFLPMGYDVTVYSRDEAKQFELKTRWPTVKCVLGDVLNYQRLTCVLSGYDVVIHTAAVKFIPEAENNISECIDINVLGSRQVFQAALDCGVGTVCAISTDKACLPLNTYGMTKALMEKLVVEYSRYSSTTKYVACRYGNVIGSTGSVIPIFGKQAVTDGIVKVTDPDMTRYWISPAQAVDLVLYTLSRNSGEIVIPTPSSMRIGDLAALQAAPWDARVEVVGVRPGEKKHEQLLHAQESVRAEQLGTHYILHPDGVYSEPFQLSSETPDKWWEPTDMAAEIDTAAYV